MLIKKFCLSSIIIWAGTAAPAFAQISEVRAGISEFDEETTGINWAVDFANENSVGINIGVVFDEPKFLKWALTPQPYIGGMVNLEGHTSYAAAGLLWRQSLGEKFYTDFSLGLAVHDGTLDVRLEEPFNEDFFRLFSEIEFGSRILFKPQLGLGYRVTDEWAGEIFYEHLSHANLLDDKNNDGVDIIGARVARRF